jgi:Protein of unknown function (DUF1295)
LWCTRVLELDICFFVLSSTEGFFLLIITRSQLHCHNMHTHRPKCGMVFQEHFLHSPLSRPDSCSSVQRWESGLRGLEHFSLVYVYLQELFVVCFLMYSLYRGPWITVATRDSTKSRKIPASLLISGSLKVSFKALSFKAHPPPLYLLPPLHRLPGTWTVIVGLPVYLVRFIICRLTYILTYLSQANALPAAHHVPLGPRDYISFAIFASSLAFEVIADYQKSAWRAKKTRGEHNEKFIKSGLWSISRHPKSV